MRISEGDRTFELDAEHDYHHRHTHARSGGVETVAQLREEHPGLRIIAMSAHALDELPEAAKFGAARTIVKPFAVDTLTKLVDEVLRGEDPEEEDDIDGPDELVIDDDIEWPDEEEDK